LKSLYKKSVASAQRKKLIWKFREKIGKWETWFTTLLWDIGELCGNRFSNGALMCHYWRFALVFQWIPDYSSYLNWFWCIFLAFCFYNRRMFLLNLKSYYMLWASQGIPGVYRLTGLFSNGHEVVKDHIWSKYQK
jgi:hypothetical protein